MGPTVVDRPFVVTPDTAPTEDYSETGTGAVVNFAMRLFDIAPGENTPYHQHPWEHEVFIVEGSGELRTADTPQPFSTGEAVYVPPNAMHQFRNTGPNRLKFICVIPNSGDC